MGDAPDKPPPCPWCAADAIRELEHLGTSNRRWFECDQCRRVFYIQTTRIDSPDDKPRES